MMQDEIKRKFAELEKRITILEGGEVKPAPKAKPVERKPEAKPQIGTTSNPFKDEQITKVTPSLDKEQKKDIVEELEEEPYKDGFTKENFDEVVDKESLDKKPLDIDPLDKHLNDKKLEEKYGDRVEEAKRLIAEMDNDKE